MVRKSLLALVLASAALASQPVRAQDAGRGSLEAEAGVASFNGDLSRNVKFGPGWGLRATMPLSPMVSAALGYGGALTRISGPSTAGSPMVTSSAAFLAAQLDFTPDLGVHPLVSAGLGMMRNSVPSRAQVDYRTDTAGIVPLGLGFLVDLSDQIGLGVRFNYLLTFGNKLTRTGNNLTADLWSTTVALSYRL